MRRMVCVALVLAVAGCWVAALAAEEPAIEPKERIDLFNGKDLSNWKLHVRGDATKTFYVENGVVKCTGRPAGYMRTAKRYKNYKFVMEWRFTKPGNSGVLVHMSLPDRVWPKSIECQGMYHNQGDFFVIGGTDFKEHKGQRGRRGHRVHRHRGLHLHPERGRRLGSPQNLPRTAEEISARAEPLLLDE